jgi:adenylate cyclase
MTAMGDVVNTTARLASAAGPGEILVTTSAAASAGLSTERVERRSLTLKGKSQPTDVLVLGVSAA